MEQKNNIGTIAFIIFLFLAGGGLIWYATTGMNSTKDTENKENTQEQEQETKDENEENSNQESSEAEEETEEENPEEENEEEPEEEETENTSSTSGNYTDFSITGFAYRVEAGVMHFEWNVTKATASKNIEYTTQKTGNTLNVTFKNVTKDLTVNYINGTCAEETCIYNLVENWAPTVEGVYSGKTSIYEFTLAEGRNFELDFDTEGKVVLLVK
ncbi:hypothetical protein JW962_01765 [Candidatus Dojkabacteria bacterium]|nr:hypothetical protein [Candidatus Dojkabacteria bacterium]